MIDCTSVQQLQLASKRRCYAFAEAQTAYAAHFAGLGKFARYTQSHADIQEQNDLARSGERLGSSV